MTKQQMADRIGVFSRKPFPGEDWAVDVSKDALMQFGIEVKRHTDVVRSQASDWISYTPSSHIGDAEYVKRLIARLSYADNKWRNVIEVSRDVCSGKPVITGTRFTVAQLIAEIADGQDILTISDDFDIDHKVIEDLLGALSIYLDRSLTD